MRPIRTSLIACAAALAIPAAAQADTLETPAPNSTNFTSSGGWQAWSAVDAAGANRLQVRKPDGTVLTPEIPAFPTPVDASIGTLGGGVNGDNSFAAKRLSAVYSRCEPESRLGCDVFALDLTTLREAKVPALAKPGVEETFPSVASGNWTLGLQGGGKKGTYAYSARGGFKRLTTHSAFDTATSTSRSAYVLRTNKGYGVQLKRSSNGKDLLVPAGGLAKQPRALQLTRYRAGWLIPEAQATRVFQTNRFGGSGDPQPLETIEARTLPAGVVSAAGGVATLFERYLDAAGVQTLTPPIR